MVCYWDNFLNRCSKQFQPFWKKLWRHVGNAKVGLNRLSAISATPSAAGRRSNLRMARTATEASCSTEVYQGSSVGGEKLRRLRCDIGETHGDGQQVFNPMAHLAGEQFIAFFGLLSASDVEKHAEHLPFVQGGIIAQSPRRDPAYLIANHDAEIDLV